MLVVVAAAEAEVEAEAAQAQVQVVVEGPEPPATWHRCMRRHCRIRRSLHRVSQALSPLQLPHAAGQAPSPHASLRARAGGGGPSRLATRTSPAPMPSSRLQSKSRRCSMRWPAEAQARVRDPLDLARVRSRHCRRPKFCRSWPCRSGASATHQSTRGLVKKSLPTHTPPASPRRLESTYLLPILMT